MNKISIDDLPHIHLAIDDNLYLRQLHPDDGYELFALVHKNRDHLDPWLPWVKYTVSPSDSINYISDIIDKRREGSEYGFGIISNEKIIGHVSIMHANHAEKIPEIGYWIAKKESKKGLTTKVVTLLTDFGLNTMNFSEIIIKSNINNVGSNRVAEKNNYELIGKENNEQYDELLNIWKISK